MLAKKFRPDVFLRRLTRQRFDAGLTNLEQMSIFVRTWPRTALTIEPIFFIDLDPIAKPARESALARRKFQTLKHRVHSSSDPIRRAQLWPRFFFWRLCASS